jgi:glutamate-1-semialdehyde 2,1-aminomutase
MVLKTEEIVGEYMKRTSESKKMFDKASQLIPGAVGSAIRFIRPYPFFIKRAKGSKIWDVDGNEYIDYCLAYGPLVTGHAHPKIVEAVKEQAEDGLMYGYPHEKTALLIEELKRRYPMTNMWRLANSGTEATMHAIRHSKYMV